MPKLIAHTVLAEDASRIDAEIPVEYQNLNAYMVVCKWTGSGIKLNYACPNANLGTSKAYAIQKGNGIYVEDIFYCARNMRKESGAKIGITSGGATGASYPITSLGILQYYNSDNVFVAGSSIDVYAINTEVPT